MWTEVSLHGHSGLKGDQLLGSLPEALQLYLGLMYTVVFTPVPPAQFCLARKAKGFTFQLLKLTNDLPSCHELIYHSQPLIANNKNQKKKNPHCKVN